ncbi:26S proteasome non-ATPase regulatory subunit 10 [Acropora cervicornis]|uniref:26S proteasome non-ATPase regulatory subunit 10 n=1 Tax=Acropora cervicornis TaxID=6130 RepID=A0AAD9QXH7_ACRCE|nr:26S proteasome non-ATPase regulatory subunit 10 [Acropora cervicornis]
MRTKEFFVSTANKPLVGTLMTIGDITNERMPLHWVASGGHSDIARFLLDLRVPVDKKDDSQWTPLMIAVSAGRDAVISMLIACGADVNSTNKGGQTPLHYAASKNRYEVSPCHTTEISQVDASLQLPIE